VLFRSGSSFLDGAEKTTTAMSQTNAHGGGSAVKRSPSPAPPNAFPVETREGPNALAPCDGGANGLRISGSAGKQPERFPGFQRCDAGSEPLPHFRATSATEKTPSVTNSATASRESRPETL